MRYKLTVGGDVGEAESKDLLLEKYFVDPSQWWDYRAKKV